MKKIKSVKLNKDFPGYAKGTPLIDLEDGKWSFNLYDNAKYTITFMRKNPDFFEIEYEEERKYIDVRIECDWDYCLPDEDILSYVLTKEWYLKNANLKVTKLTEGTK